MWPPLSKLPTVALRMEWHKSSPPIESLVRTLGWRELLKLKPLPKGSLLAKVLFPRDYVCTEYIYFEGAGRIAVGSLGCRRKGLHFRFRLITSADCRNLTRLSLPFTWHHALWNDIIDGGRGGLLGFRTLRCQLEMTFLSVDNWQTLLQAYGVHRSWCGWSADGVSTTDLGSRNTTLALS